MPNAKQLKNFSDKQLSIWLFLGFILVTLCISWLTFASYVTQLELSTQGHSLIDYVNASAQRLVKLEITGDINDELVFNLDNTIAELTPVAGESSEYYADETEIIQGLVDVSIDWEVVRTALEQFRADGEYTSLVSASERLFYHAANLTNLSSDYISRLSLYILRLEQIIVVQIALAAFVIARRLFITLMELKRNRALSASMFIDSATGLFNRSKCHEILRSLVNDELKSRSMIVFDLNDLKKTNDNYGHRVGDELIYSFAQIIKSATKVHTNDVFVGRYGGDEFMVYYSSVDEQDVKLYLDEVAFLAEEFNEKETRFQVSYAAGYALGSAKDKDMSLRQLFDVADQDMYANKAEMKKKRAEMQATNSEQNTAER